MIKNEQKKQSSLQSQKPSKKIILFADGTGNSSSNPHKTNVWRFYKALDLSPKSGQVAYYTSGVGTDSFLPFALIGKAFGWGLASNVKQMYTFLCRTYNPGDEISLFGFSRGAFTVRVLAGLIANQGIISVKSRTEGSGEVIADDADLTRLVGAAYRQFRSDAFNPSFLSFFGAPVRDAILACKDLIFGNKPYEKTNNFTVPITENENENLIKFIGVWDTVDAYGMPVDEMTKAWDRLVWPLSAKDRNLSNRVQHARHALALDEQRQTFEPMLWNENNKSTWSRNDRPSLYANDLELLKNKRSLLQVWFAGVHANAGGGYPDDSLAYVSLDWMINEAKAYANLSFVEMETDKISTGSNPLGPAHDSRAWAGNIYRLDPRNLERLGNFQKPGLIGTIGTLKRRISKTPQGLGEDINKVKIVTPIIHHSVFGRIHSDGNGYAPLNIPADYRVHLEDHSIQKVTRDNDVAIPFENHQNAQARSELQNVIWNTVWYRKIIYLFALFLFVLFLIYPYLQARNIHVPLISGLNGPQEQWVGTIAYAVRTIPRLIGMIPGFGFAATWTEAYSQFPFPFISLLTPVVLLMVLSIYIGTNANGRMRQAWAHVNGSVVSERTHPNWTKKLANFLNGEVYQKLRKSFRVLLELVMLAVFAYFILIGAMFILRAPLLVAELAGTHCKPALESENKLGKSFTFEANDPCFATGITLESGRTYLIEMKVNTDNNKWKDGSMDADLRGWKAEQSWEESASLWERAVSKIKVGLGIPLRRNLLSPWYQPFARLDQYWFDRYELKNQKDLYSEDERNVMDESSTHDCLRTLIKARKTEQLYLYLNDGMSIHQSLGHDFYKNNQGYAETSVKEYTANETDILPFLCKH